VRNQESEYWPLALDQSGAADTVDPVNPKEAAIQIAARLIEGLPAEEVWLFGSRARGEAGPDSDLDFLAVVEDSDLPGYQRSRSAYSIVADIRLPKDIVVLTREEWRRQEGVVNTLPYIARKEGVLLRSR
jgi:predicted nucleotidyltransferase